MKKLLIIIILIALTGCTQSDLGANKVKEWEKAGSPLKLKATKDKILDVQEVDDIQCADELDMSTCVNKGKIKKYFYISDKKLAKEKLEHEGKSYDEHKRTSNAIIWKVDKPKDKKGLLGASEIVAEKDYFVGKFYGGSPFYQEPDTGDWYQTETATTTIEAYDVQTATTTKEMILSWLGGRAIAETTTNYYSKSGDGMMMHTSSHASYSWGDLIAGNGVNFDYSDNLTLAYFSNDANLYNYQLYKPLFIFDTSGLGTGATITAAKTNIACFLKYVSTGRGAYDYTNWYQYTGSNPPTASKTNFLAVGSTKGSVDRDISSNWSAADAYNVDTLNAAGISWINKTGDTILAMRQGWDYDGVDPGKPSKYSYVRIYFSDETGTSKDPYLEITYTEASIEEPTYDSVWFY